MISSEHFVVLFISKDEIFPYETKVCIFENCCQLSMDAFKLGLTFHRQFLFLLFL